MVWTNIYYIWFGFILFQIYWSIMCANDCFNVEKFDKVIAII